MPGAVDDILSTLQWAGIAPDEGGILVFNRARDACLSEPYLSREHFFYSVICKVLIRPMRRTDRTFNLSGCLCTEDMWINCFR